ncbi:hypothetical protein ACWDRB_55145 [Nonomuraea sp. NPDC003707]
MTAPLKPDDINRTVLLAAHDGSQPTLQAAITAHAATGIIISADNATCSDANGQAALLTAVATATRAFGTAAAILDAPETLIARGPFTGRTLAEAITDQGAHLVANEDRERISTDSADWPAVLIGADAFVPPDHARRHGKPRPIFRASWSGWAAHVHTGQPPPQQPNGQPCVFAAITAAALAISEGFAYMRARPGSDAGFRDITLNLWNLSHDGSDNGPALVHAPNSWWLVGLGHLGQAYSWAISWLPYLDPAEVHIILQDVDRTVPGNHSTGVLTPRDSLGTPKTRLVAAALDHAGFTTQIIERRLGPDLRRAADESHVALIGVDNLRTRRMISNVGWRTAIDIGLGSGSESFSSLLMRRFPGNQASDEVEAWATDPRPTAVPATQAFADLRNHHDACGMVELAGIAVGASFVGIVAACIGLAEATRELHGGTGCDILAVDLVTMDLQSAAANVVADIISIPL